MNVVDGSVVNTESQNKLMISIDGRARQLLVFQFPGLDTDNLAEVVRALEGSLAEAEKNDVSFVERAL